MVGWYLQTIIILVNAPKGFQCVLNVNLADAHISKSFDNEHTHMTHMRLRKVEC